jgi:hypothetical protein
MVHLLYFVLDKFMDFVEHIEIEIGKIIIWELGQKRNIVDGDIFDGVTGLDNLLRPLTIQFKRILIAVENL